jgi:broad specificity phosphatase PhoE
MPTRLILIAHAPTSATRHAAFPDDEPAEPLRAPPPDLGRFDRLLVAPERRTQQTAAAFRWSAAVENLLRDLDPGAWRGKSFDALLEEVPEALAAWTSDSRFRPPGGESVEDLLARLKPWLDAQREQGGRLAVITHPAVLRGILIAALEAPSDLFWQIDAGPLARLDLRSNGHRWTLRSLTPAD